VIAATSPPSTGAAEYRDVNRRVWTYLAEHGSDSSRPYGAEQLARARDWLAPDDWLPWTEIGSVLCLAAGGGQQGLLFASLGYDVTVVDLCPEQLELDAQAAAAHGLELECVDADMLDLSALHDRGFDLVHQPISACYVPDAGRLYEEVAQVLRPGGWYDVEHWNPIHVQLAGLGAWRDGAYVIERPLTPGVPVPWFPADEGADVVCWHYVHPLDALVGGLCRAGFRIMNAAERTRGDEAATPGTADHLAAYAPPFFRLLARLGPE
jgi:SAM-dependent methyltransferase